MTNQQKKSGNDGELASILIVIGIVFSGTLIAADIFYGNMSGLLNSWVKWPFVVLHVLALIQWFVVVKTISEPNLEWVRWTLTFTLLAALLLVMAHRSGWVSQQMFQQDVDENKQEQNAN